MAVIEPEAVARFLHDYAAARPAAAVQKWEGRGAQVEGIVLGAGSFGTVYAGAGGGVVALTAAPT